MTNIGSHSIDGHIGIVQIDSPPVNALGVAVRSALVEHFEAVIADDAVKAIVLICGGRTFFAGADITEFGKPMQQPDLLDVLNVIENSPKPVVAAIHGTALGGGLEVALACHYRVAVPSAKVGLPEVKLGLLPGAGGTQRLPRIVGPQVALDIMCTGKMVKASEANKLGIIDALVAEGELGADAIAFATQLVAEGKPPVRVRDRADMIQPSPETETLFADYRRANARAFRGFKAPENIIRAVEAAVTLPFDEGMARERELFMELMNSSESAAQRYYFFAERETVKVPDVPPSVATLPIASVGVIGAGTMGGGITMNFLNVGLPVTLVEMSEEALDRGIGVIRRNYENSAKKGRMTQEQVEQRMALIKPAIGLDALHAVDLVIEAVFEQMSIKQDVFGKLDKICKPGAILASNTSYLNIDTIAAATTRPEWVMGLHFFSPANVMPLLEVVRGAKTAPQLIATALKLGKTIGKVPVVSRVCDGFIANRIMTKRGVQALELVLEGPTPTQIDKVLYDYGFAMGQFAMMDLVGLDVIGRDANVRTLNGDMVAAGRLGQKKNGGYYDYDENRRASPSPVAAQIIADFAAHQGITSKRAYTADEILARLLFPVVNEGAKLVEEGIVIRASDIDVAAILGYNWPIYTGGPMFWADHFGLAKIVAGLKALEAEYGDVFTPSKLLEEKAAKGEYFTR